MTTNPETPSRSSKIFGEDFSFFSSTLDVDSKHWNGNALFAPPSPIVQMRLFREQGRWELGIADSKRENDKYKYVKKVEGRLRDPALYLTTRDHFFDISVELQPRQFWSKHLTALQMHHILSFCSNCEVSAVCSAPSLFKFAAVISKLGGVGGRFGDHLLLWIAPI